MPAAIKPTIQTWKPVGPGKGGTFTNATYHDMDPESTYQIGDCIVDKNSWRVRYNDTQYGPTVGAASSTSIEVFNRYSGVLQTITSSVITGFTGGVVPPYVANMTSGAVIRSSAGNVPLGTGRGRFVFAPVKNRLYMANGTDAPAISPDATANSCQPWGFLPQATNLAYQINQPGTGANAGWVGGTQGVCNVNGAGTGVTFASGVNFEYFQAGAVIVIGGARSVVTFVTSPNQITVAPAVAAGAAQPFSYAPTGIIGNGTFTGTVPGPALNTMTVWTGPAFVVGPPSFPVGGVPLYPIGVKYTEATVSGVAALVMGSTYAEAVGAVVRATQINLSNITFEGAAYQYAASYFNPTSGHVTNPSPILSVKDGAPNNANVSITISNIVPNNDPNYTKIILWRSIKNGSQLFPLTLLNNNTGNAPGGTITYTDFLGDDTALGTVIGGPGKVSCPTGQNSPPPVDLNYIQYWDGRFWGASQTQIGILFFSARSAGNNEDISVGVPEECWPTDFTLAIPESDGRITGLRTVSTNLFVLTDNNTYAVIGNTKQNYSLVRVSGKGRGTSHFLTAVLPSEDTNSSDVLVHMGNDGRLYFLFGGGGDFAVSYPVQDQIANVQAIGIQHTVTSTYVVACESDRILLYDVERKIWIRRGTGAPCFAEGLLNGVVTQFVGTFGQGTILRAEQQTGTPSSFSVTTNQFSPGGDKKDNKLLEAVAVYYTNRVDTIAVTALIDVPPGSPPSVTLTEVPNTGNYAAYFEDPDARIFVPQGTVAMGRLFQFSVLASNPSSFQNAIYEIRAVFSGSQSQEAVSASL